ncbi:unnamed protein product [Mytilus coruscus]|uniref:Uncharacterized protein n=1 Tax=Mytilus coruscus TaxID=42192 RepID=A0A6J8F5F9_MYTCO|nr:unnamed protein product [Mytilus coruscus]
MHRKSSLPVTKMDELPAKKLPRDRTANFISIEANLISSRGGFSTEVTNQKKNAVWKLITEALDRHHSNLQNNQQTCPVADDAEGTDRNATCPGPSSSASSQSKRSSSSCSIQPAPKKKKTTKDVYSLQCAVLEKELEKNILQIDLLKKLLGKYDNLDSDALELLSVLGQ